MALTTATLPPTAFNVTKAIQGYTTAASRRAARHGRGDPGFRDFVQLDARSHRRHGAWHVRVYQDADGAYFIRRGNGRAYLTGVICSSLDGKPLSTMTVTVGRAIRASRKPADYQ